MNVPKTLIYFYEAESLAFLDAVHKEVQLQYTV